MFVTFSIDAFIAGLERIYANPDRLRTMLKRQFIICWALVALFLGSLILDMVFYRDVLLRSDLVFWSIAIVLSYVSLFVNAAVFVLLKQISKGSPDKPAERLDK